MAYNTAEFFLKGDPVNYNFEFECDVNEYIQKSALDRFLTYQASAKERMDTAYDSGKQFVAKIIGSGKYSSLGDCDGSSEKGNVNLIYDIYLKLWNWKKETGTAFGRIQSDVFQCQFGGETMNSMNTILDNMVKSVVNKDENRNFLNKRIGNISINYILALYAEYKQEFLSKLEAEGSISEYADYYHTIGNFTLVPSKFNQWRGFNKKIKDFWDLSLGYLKESGWKEDFNYHGCAIADYYRYINYFFLWDYVDGDGNYVRLMQSENKAYFLKTAIKFIKRRSIFMVTMLRLQSALGDAEYTKLRESIFLKSDGVYGDYDQVISAVKHHIKREMTDEMNRLLADAKKDINEYQI